MADPCGVNKIDSNVSGLAFAEEECIKLLPGVDGADAVWYEAEPNSYGSFGSEVTTKARAPINRSRQKRKGSVIDMDASGDFNTDFTPSNTQRLMQGFMFADAREQPSTQPLNGAKVAITAVSANDGYAAAAGLGVFAVGDIILASGFAVPVNNGLHVATAVTATAIDSSNVTAAEATPPAAAKLERVGKVAAAADLSFSFANGVAQLVSASNAVPFAGAMPGTWLFIGGDVTGSAFANNVGYARVKSSTAGALVFDQTTWTPVTEAGTGKSIQVFIGTIIRNEKDPALIKRRTYQFERTVGEDAEGTQAEYLIGAVANTLSLDAPQADFVTLDMAFVGCDVEYRTGLEGVKEGVHIPSLGEEAFNTTSNIYRTRLALPNASDPNSAALFGSVMESSIEIDNGVTGNKRQGSLGAFDTSAGDFTVSGSITAYFTTVEAVRAIRRAADVGLYTILAADNKGVVLDIPQMTLSGGMINVEKDEPITIQLDNEAAEGEYGYTMLAEYFNYLPTIAMPRQG